MTNSFLASAILIVLNGLLCILARHTARRSGIEFDLRRPVPISMLAAGTAFEILAVHTAALSWSAAALDIALSAAVISAATDAETGYIFDAVTVPAGIIVISLSTFSHAFAGSILGAAASGGCLAFLYVVTYARGIGLGDVKLACCTGAALGVTASLEALGIAFVTGGLYAALLLFFLRAGRGTAIRFGPYIAAGALATVILGRAS